MTNKVGFLIVACTLIEFSVAYSAIENSCFPLQVGNTWTYFWGYEIPENCYGIECLMEGGGSTTKITRTIVINNKTYYIIRTSQFTNYARDSLIHNDTLLSQNEVVYRYNKGNDVVWLDFSNSLSHYTFSGIPDDTFNIWYSNNSMWPNLYHSQSFNIDIKTILDTVTILRNQRIGLIKHVDYYDTNSTSKILCWSEKYCPGVGLVYSEEIRNPSRGTFCVLESAVIDGIPLKVIRPKIIKADRSRAMTDTYRSNQLFTIQGRIIQGSDCSAIGKKSTLHGVFIDNKSKLFFK